jgi:hypothetical protein
VSRAAVTLPQHGPRPHQMAVFIVVLSVVSWGLGAFAAWPWSPGGPRTAYVRVSVKHVTPPLAVAQVLSADELAKLPPHMRPQGGAPTSAGRRADAVLTLELDGRPVLTRTLRPTGLHRDGPIHAYEEIRVAPGRHRVTVRLASAQGSGPTETRALGRDVDVSPGQVLLFEHVAGTGWRE